MPHASPRRSSTQSYLSADPFSTEKLLILCQKCSLELSLANIPFKGTGSPCRVFSEGRRNLICACLRPSGPGHTEEATRFHSRWDKGEAAEAHSRGEGARFPGRCRLTPLQPPLSRGQGKTGGRKAKDRKRRRRGPAVGRGNADGRRQEALRAPEAKGRGNGQVGMALGSVPSLSSGEGWATPPPPAKTLFERSREAAGPIKVAMHLIPFVSLNQGFQTCHHSPCPWHQSGDTPCLHARGPDGLSCPMDTLQRREALKPGPGSSAPTVPRPQP